MKTHAARIVIGALALLTSVATAAEYFVATGGSDANAGTAGSPFATINRAAAVAKAGDTVWIKPGTYQPAEIIRPAQSGTSTAPILYRAQPGGEVIIDGQLNLPPKSSDGVFTINKKSWIILDGLRVINSHWFGIYVRGSTDVIVRNCSTKNTYASGIFCGSSTNVQVLNNSVQLACTAPKSTPIKNTQECITMASCSNFEVAYNTVFDRPEDNNNGGEGIDTKSACRNGKVHHNLVRDLIRLGIYCDAYMKQLDNIEIYANTVHHCASGIVVACEEGGTARGVSIHDNLIYDCPRLGIRLAGYLKNGAVQDVTVHQNTVVRCGFGGSAWENSGLLVEADNPTNRNFVIRNNIFADNRNQIRTKGQAYVTIDHNLLHGASLVPGKNTIVADPLFVNARENDFRLSPGSPAIGKAVGQQLSDKTGHQPKP